MFVACTTHVFPPLPGMGPLLQAQHKKAMHLQKWTVPIEKSFTVETGQYCQPCPIITAKGQLPVLQPCRSGSSETQNLAVKSLECAVHR